MNNLEFFKSCFSNEITATVNLLKCMPSDSLDYRPHEVNRSAKEIISHILSHIVDLDVILNKSYCDETMSFDFIDSAEAAIRFEDLCKIVNESLIKQNSSKWENEEVQLAINGKAFVKLSRMQMMWFFFFDIIHHRGQLSSYVRPMGGKNPAIYGYSADTI